MNSRHVRRQIFLQRTQASFLRTFPLVLFSSVAWTGIEILWHCPLPPALPFQPQTSDLQLVRDALRSLRNSFSGHDPQHHTIDSLEQGISSLMERLHVVETQKKQERKVTPWCLAWASSWAAWSDESVFIWCNTRPCWGLQLRFHLSGADGWRWCDRGGVTEQGRDAWWLVLSSHVKELCKEVWLLRPQDLCCCFLLPISKGSRLWMRKQMGLVLETREP